jgi:hypothetical protein
MASDAGQAGITVGWKLLKEWGAVPLLLTGPMPEERLATWREWYAEVVVVDDPYDPDQLAQGAAEAAERQGVPLRGVFTVFDGLIVPAAEAAASLGLPHPSLRGVRAARVKYATRVMSREAGLPGPRFALLSSAGEAAAVAGEVGLPAIVKPLNGTASHLIRKVRTVEELAGAYDALAGRIRRSFGAMYLRPLEIDPRDGRKADPATSFLVEELMSGPEFCADVVVRDGVVEPVLLMDKFIIHPDTTFECGLTWPPVNADEREVDAIWACTEATLHALGVDNTVAHVEVMLTSDGPRIIEVNAGRAGGQLIPLLAPMIAGVDLGEEFVALQCGVEPGPRATPDPGERVSSMSIFAGRGGRLTAIGGIEELEALEGVETVVPTVKPGDLIDSADYEIFALMFIVRGITDPGELEALYERACSLVTFEFED